MEILLKADSHPNVVTFYGWEEDESFVYLALEKCKGSLYDLMVINSKNKRKKRSQLHKFKSNECLLKLLCDAAKGLNFLHSINIVHRDIKPMNILIDK